VFFRKHNYKQYVSNQKNISNFEFKFQILMENKELDILSKISNYFLCHGFKKNTMDDLAKGLKISKKTLYKFANNRKDLILKCMQFIIDNEVFHINQILELKLNAIEENFEIAKYFTFTLDHLNPSVQNDLKNYYPEAWELWLNHQKSFVLNVVADNIERGKKEGLYKQDVKSEIIAPMYMYKTELIFNNDIFPKDKIGFLDVFITYLTYHIRGLASQKGIEIYNNLNFNNLKLITDN
jgi:AcrR family transcriptional regulator